ncbi:protein of unknown function [Xenorhabdus poinarii G6]|uniref:Uncharacterized protein n=1 Tax=Xenorhabdus poinarii G6 TaxID=1354304 RepID=A0A068R4F7_9GAMM|nr:protein of unknown function [Xenorhabdus poinarii G6]
MSLVRVQLEEPNSIHPRVVISFFDMMIPSEYPSQNRLNVLIFQN